MHTYLHWYVADSMCPVNRQFPDKPVHLHPAVPLEFHDDYLYNHRMSESIIIQLMYV